MDDIVRGLPAVRDDAFEAMPVADQLDALRLDSLRKVREVLHLSTDLVELGGDRMMQHRRYRMQLEAAQTIINGSIKLDDVSLRHQERQDLLDTIKERLDKIKQPDKPS